MKTQLGMESGARNPQEYILGEVEGRGHRAGWGCPAQTHWVRRSLVFSVLSR